MARPRFAEMLVDRRRQLGLSISQASQVLRLKEQVLIAFEEGDFERIPKSGYAQGMLASYARYLGLNSRQVVNQFSQDLYEYANTTGRSGRPASDDQPSYAGPYVESHGLLPTSGGLAGDMGAFSTTSQPHSRSQSTPLVNARRYVGTAGRSTESALDGALSEQYEQEYATTSRARTSQTRTVSRGYEASSEARARRASGYQAYERDQVTTRRAVTSENEDDMAYEDSQQPQSNRPRRSSSKRSSSQRSGASRRSSSQRRRSSSARRGATKKQSSILENRSLLAGLIALAAIVLLVIAVLGMRSCMNKKSTTTDDQSTVPVSTTNEGTTTTQQQQGQGQTSSSTSGEVDTSKTDTTATTTTDDKDTEGTTKKETTPKQTRVVVSVDAGNVSWVDIVCDGESKIADTVTGPWSQTYDVHESIVIEVGDTAAVTVTENGVRKQFDTKTSGIGSITIQGTPAPETDNDKDTDTKKKDEDSDTEDDEESEKKEDSKKKDDDSDSDSGSDNADHGEDEFVMTYNGYDVYYSASEGIYYFYGDDGLRYDASNGTLIG